MEQILAFFASLGLPLTFWPAEEDMRALYQYDGELNGYVVQLYPGRNALHQDTCFGHMDAPGGDSIDITLSMEEWKNEESRTQQRVWITKFMQEHPLSR